MRSNWRQRLFFILFCAVLAAPALTYAGQISVPSAPGYGYILVGTSTGNYVPTATSSTNFFTITTSGTSGAATYSGGTLNVPQYSSGGGGGSNISTTTGLQIGQGAYFTGASPTILGGFSTSSLTATLPLSLSNPIAVIGPSASALTLATTSNSLFAGTAGQVLAFLSGGWTGAATTTFTSPLLYASGAVTCQTASGSLAGCLSSADWNTFNNKVSFGKTWELANNQYAVLSITPTTTVPLWIQSTATSSVMGGFAAPIFNATSTTASSTFANGVDITSGCFSVLGTCLQTFIQNATAFKSAANYATVAVLSGTPTYANGTSGVGATLTEVGTGALSVDGSSPAVGNRVLVKNQADQTQNGVYTVTVAGSGIASYVITRATDFNSSNDIYAGVTVPVLSGSTLGGTSWVQTTTGVIVIGAGQSNIVFAEASASGGGVSAVSVATANGFAGSSNGGATPALTITTTASGLLKGNGTAISAAALTDFPTQTSNTVLANLTGGTAAPTAIASTSLFAGTNGQVLTKLGGVWTGVATTTFSCTTVTCSFASGQESFSIGSNALALSQLPQISANRLWGNITGASANAAEVSTSSLFAAGTAGSVLTYTSAGTWVLTATTTFNSPLAYANGAVSCATCLTGNQSITLTGAVTGSGATAITTAFGNLNANSVLGVVAGTAGTPTSLATSSQLFSGTAGQFPIFTGTNALAGTSTIFTSTASFVGIASSTPYAVLSVNAPPAQIAFSVGSTTAELLKIDANGKVVVRDIKTAYVGVISPLRSLTLQTGTTTTWTATTSGAYIPTATAGFAGTLRDITCNASTTKAFLGVAVYINSGIVTPSYFVASATPGIITFTGSNTFNRGDLISMLVGTTTTDINANQINCTLRTTETP